MSNLKSLSAQEILTTYELPHRFLSYFTSQVAKDRISKLKDPDPRVLKAIDIDERFGNGEEISLEIRKQVYDDINGVIMYDYYPWSARLAAYAAAHLAACAANYAYAAYAAYKDLLLELIQTRLTELERVLIFGEE